MTTTATGLCTLPAKLVRNWPVRGFTAASCVVGTTTWQNLDLTDLVRGENQHAYHSWVSPYAGHQFGQWVPELGDGRLVTLATAASATLCATRAPQFVQLKGVGPTPYSRQNDGWLSLGAALAEYYWSKYLHLLGYRHLPALAVFRTGEQVARGRARPGAVLVRETPDPSRLGSFIWLAQQQDFSALAQLVQWVWVRHYQSTRKVTKQGTDTAPEPETRLAVKGSDGEPTDKMVMQLAAAFGQRLARETAAWVQAGLVHGVLNSDNIHGGGFALDVADCAQLDNFAADWQQVHHTEGPRYAYLQQPAAMQWNFGRWLSSVTPLLEQAGWSNEACRRWRQTHLADFAQEVEATWGQRMAMSLGFRPEATQADAQVQALLRLLEQHRLPYLGSLGQLRGALTDVTEQGATPAQAVAAQVTFEPLTAFARDWLTTLSESTECGAMGGRAGTQQAHWQEALRLARSQAIPPAATPTALQSALQAAEDDHMAPFKALLADLAGH